MPKLKLEKSYSVAASQAFAKIKSILENDADLKKLDPKFSCRFDDKTQTGVATGQFFKADLEVSGDDVSSSVAIVVDLPMMMLPFKGMIEKTLTKKMDQVLS